MAALNGELVTLCERYGIDDIETLSDEIVSRSEEATRNAIRKLKPGTYHGEAVFDVPGGEVITLKTAVTVDAEAGSSSSISTAPRRRRPPASTSS